MKNESISNIVKFLDKNYPECEAVANSFYWRIFVRKPSYYLSAIFIKAGFKPNTVTYMSLYASLIAFFIFIFSTSEYYLLAAIFLNLWNILDAVDGNVARYTGQTSKFGHFLDTVACYYTIALSFVAIGYAAEHTENHFNILPEIDYLLLGALASISNILMRLIYQNKKNSLDDLKALEVESIKIPLLRKIDIEVGISGLFMLAVILSAIFSTYNLMIIFYAFYYVSALTIFSFRELRE
jgi:phosphatidylglycerophosphate synthase